MADPTASLLNSEAQDINSLAYTPLNLTQLQQQAEATAAQNVAGSLALQQQYQPGVAASNAGVQQLIGQNIQNPGAIPADIQTQVGREAAGQAGGSGLLGSNSGYTAATLGNTALNLQNQRIQQSLALGAANPNPVSGLDPSYLAQAAFSQNQAGNQFGLSKLGAQANLANSRIGAYGAQQMAGGASTGGFGLPGAPVGSYLSQTSAYGGPGAGVGGYSSPTDPIQYGGGGGGNAVYGSPYAGGNLNGVGGTFASAGGFGLPGQTDTYAQNDALAGVGAVGDF